MRLFSDANLTTQVGSTASVLLMDTSLASASSGFYLNLVLILLPWQLRTHSALRLKGPVRLFNQPLLMTLRLILRLILVVLAIMPIRAHPLVSF